ncbi:MAG: ribonuclease R [bacterium]|nr:MAG: ribonuclease R [bacterium]
MSRRYSRRPPARAPRTGKQDRDKILGFLRGESTRPLLPDELADSLGIQRKERASFNRTLASLIRSGSVIRIKGGRITAPARIHLRTGTLRVTQMGNGILIPEGGDEEVGIGPAHLKTAMNGDRVVVRVEGRDGQGRPLGKVIRVVERAHREIVIHYRRRGGISFGVPYDSRLGGDILIGPGAEGKAQPGHLAVLRLTDYGGEGRPARGEVVEILGYPSDPGTETQAVIHTHSIPHRFPPAAMKAAGSLRSEVPERDHRRREDLRDLPFVTIDGARARDFDDAVFAERVEDGRIRIFVAIADVSHFVRPGSPLDREALRRGNSVYFPDSVIPMLPERLSNDLCSLKPEEDRLAFTCEIEVDGRGNPVRRRIYPSVIRSSARLTYKEVEDHLGGGTPISAADSGVLGSIEILLDAFGRLNRRRQGRFALDFDFPEPEIVLDCMGQVENIYRAERYTSHRIVEECMLVANEVVAAILREAGSIGVFRVHDPPAGEKIEELNSVLRAVGYAPAAVRLRSPKSLRKIIDDARGSVRERFLNTVILRSMMRAEYSAVAKGHFGLALKDYTHFTSPIRRYADLVVHRIVKGILDYDRPVKDIGLEGICAHVTDTERRAETAGWDILALYRARFMQDRLGEEYDGIISGITSFGVFVELQEYFVEGLIRLTSLHDDYYHFREDRLMLVGEHTGRTFRIGDMIRVRVVRVDTSRRHIDFEPAENGAR